MWMKYVLPFVRKATHQCKKKKKSNSVWRLVNGMEAFRLQIVDVAVVVPVESYVLKTTGEYQDVQKKSMQSSSLCKFVRKLSSTFSIDWTISSLYNFCFSCFRSCAICDKHVNMFQTWVLNNRFCVRCSELNFFDLKLSKQSHIWTFIWKKWKEVVWVIWNVYNRGKS